MNFIERRYLYEVITMYSLEPFLEDIYVEGADDFAFYSEYYG